MARATPGAPPDARAVAARAGLPAPAPPPPRAPLTHRAHVPRRCVWLTDWVGARAEARARRKENEVTVTDLCREERVGLRRRRSCRRGS